MTSIFVLGLLCILAKVSGFDLMPPASGSLLNQSMWVIQRRVDPLDSGCQNIGHLETSGDRAMQLMTVSAAARYLGYKSR